MPRPICANGSAGSRSAIRIDVLSDGRIIQATRPPMASGWVVATHEDITERERLAAQLKQQNKLLQQREERARSRATPTSTPRSPT